MMENNILIYFDLITSLKTTEEKYRLSSEIDDLLLSIFKTESQSFDNALKDISQDFANKIKETFRKNRLDIGNKEIIRNFLIKLKELLEKLKIIRLTIVFEPSLQTIENIHNWISSNLGEGYILDIQTNQKILGGAIITFNGEYKDFSVKKNLEDFFSAKRQEFAYEKF